MEINCANCSELLYSRDPDEHEEEYAASPEIYDALQREAEGEEVHCPFCESILVLELEDEYKW